MSSTKAEAAPPSAGPRQPVIRVFDCHIARRDGAALRYLLLRRSTSALYSGIWRMVGGKVELGETVWQAALRETREETGLQLDELYSVPYVNRFYEWQHDRLNDIPVFVGVTTRDAVTLDDEHDAYEWVDAAEAQRRMVWPGQKFGHAAADELLRGEPSLRDALRIPTRANV